MREWGLGLTIIAFIAMGFRSQTYQAEIERLSREYDERIALLRAEGQPTHSRQLIPASIPDDENVMAGVRDAIESTHQEIKTRKLEHYYDIGMAEYIADDAPHEEVQALRKESAVLIPFVEQLESAVRRPRFAANIAWDDEVHIILYDISVIQEAMRGLRDYVALGPAAERTNRLIRATQVGFELSKRTELPFLLGRIVPNLIVRNVIEMLQEYAAVDNATTVLGELDAKLKELAAEPYSTQWIPEERAHMILMVDYWRRGDAYPTATGAPSLGHSVALEDGIRMIDESILWMSQETSLANAWRSRAETNCEEVRLRCSQWMTALRATAQRRYVERTAQLRLARFALQVLAHRQKHNAWPGTADVQAPLDPWTRKPCRYEIEEGQARVWMSHPDLDATEQKDWSNLVEEYLAWTWDR